MRGLCLQPGRPAGSALSDSVRAHLYRNQSSQAGLDLASINVQRGRDHGIPGYGHWLRRCLGRHMTNFEDLTPYVPPENIEIMRSLWEYDDFASTTTYCLTFGDERWFLTKAQGKSILYEGRDAETRPSTKVH